MEYSNEQEELFVSDESEFDEFEHHLSKYENNHDEELFSHEEELFNNEDELFHDESMMEQDDVSQHQISLATSFCRNTQEPNEDFLEDKFDGDLELVDNFSEDKFIRCKYSEDFYYEQCAQLKQQQAISESESDRLSDLDKHTEERSSEDERVVENRRRHFLEFISTIPKVCTPSVCGTISQRLDLSSRDQVDGSDRHLELGRLTETNEESLFEDDENELTNVKFDWSIDQLATLKPVDISFNERRFLRFKDFESDQLTQEKLTKENDMFFSQETIAPSPHKRVSFKNFNQELSESTNRFQTTKCDEDEGKDSGNYSEEQVSADSTVDSRMKSRQLDDFEQSFHAHSNRRLSTIEFDTEFKHQTNTPLRKPSLNALRQTEWNNLDFKPNCNLQTSTPCTSLFRFDQQLNQHNQLDHFNEDQEQFNQRREENFIRKPKQMKLPLAERSVIKKKKRLFHNLSSSNEITSSSISSSDLNSANSSTTTANTTATDRQSSRTNNEEDEGLSSMACDNSQVTPRLKRTRSIVKSFAERLDEIELFANDENNSNKTNSPDTRSKNLSDTSKWHNLTDSNCFVMCKNFNNLLNNSDSGCYLSSNGSSNSGLDVAKRRVLFN